MNEIKVKFTDSGFTPELGSFQKGEDRMVSVEIAHALRNAGFIDPDFTLPELVVAGEETAPTGKKAKGGS